MTKMAKPDSSLPAVEQEGLTSEEHLEAILFQFVNLYERWSEDRQVSAKHSADLAQFVKQFTHQVSKFATLEESVTEAICNTIQTQTQHMEYRVEKKMIGILSAAMKQSLDPDIKRLQSAVRDTSDTLIAYYHGMKKIHWRIIWAALGSSIMASLLIVKFFMPAPMLPLTDRQLEIYNEGVQAILHKADKEQQNKATKQSIAASYSNLTEERDRRSFYDDPMIKQVD